jgi:hypothetical protein
MSDDNVARFLRQHAATAHETCPEIPQNVHPHMLRHSRAMHLYQAGMPLALLTEWLGHADPETTLIYAHADTEMKRKALTKSQKPPTASAPARRRYRSGTTERTSSSGSADSPTDGIIPIAAGPAQPSPQGHSPIRQQLRAPSE